MKDFKLKIIVTILSGIIFSFIFIILAFSLPTTSDYVAVKKKPGNFLEHISKSAK